MSNEQQSQRPLRAQATVLARSEVEEFRVSLARLEEKMDQVIYDRKKLSRLEERMVAGEVFMAQVKTWGIVGGMVWTLVLTILGLKLWA